MNKLRQIGTVLVLALGIVGMFAVAAFAQEPATVTAANSAISDGVDSAKSMISTNIPLLLGVTGAWLALAFGRKLLRKVFGS